MRIAIIGVGSVGKALARRLAAAGHSVRLGVRPSSFAKHETFAKSIGATLDAPDAAAKVSEVIVLATPWTETENAVRSLGDLSGKILIDATNPIAKDFSGLEVGHSSSGAELVASWAQGARVVKCFNQTGYGGMEQPQFGTAKAVQFVAGDDRDACTTVLALCRDVGFEAIAAGNLEASRQLEALAWLWIQLSLKQGMGRDWAFTVARR